MWHLAVHVKNSWFNFSMISSRRFPPSLPLSEIYQVLSERDLIKIHVFSKAFWSTLQRRIWSHKTYTPKTRVNWVLSQKFRLARVQDSVFWMTKQLTLRSNNPKPVQNTPQVSTQWGGFIQNICSWVDPYLLAPSPSPPRFMTKWSYTFLYIVMHSYT